MFKRKIIVKELFLVLFFTLSCFVSTKISAQTKALNFNGYAQLRAYVANEENGFQVRRVKLWIKGTPLKTKGIDYKVQGVINNAGAFKLLDAYAGYGTSFAIIRFGRQTPEFSLQRYQSDWQIPFAERTHFVNILIPAAQTSARDVGVQVTFKKKDFGHLTLGIFDGKGSTNKQSRYSFLYTARASVNIPLVNKMQLTLAGAAAYQYVEHFSYPVPFGFTSPEFNGRDFRYDASAVLDLSFFKLLSEYLEARIGDKKASGYYVQASKIAGANQFAAIVEEYSDVQRFSQKWFWLSYSRLLNGQKTKLLFNVGKQLKGNYSAYLQFQIFFN